MEVTKEKMWLLISKIENNVLHNWISSIIESLGHSFYATPGSSHRHHWWYNGLALHTWSLTNCAIKIAEHYQSLGFKLNRDIIIAGCILQDIGKIECYEETDEGQFIELPNGNTIFSVKYKRTREDTEIHHIPISYQFARRWAEKLNIEEMEEVKHVLHIIISHHGKREWSSPCEPRTLEAFISHKADLIDSTLWANNETQKEKLGGKTY